MVYIESIWYVNAIAKKLHFQLKDFDIVSGHM